MADTQADLADYIAKSSLIGPFFAFDIRMRGEQKARLGSIAV